MISISIDVTLIDKARIKVVTRQNGAVAKFVDLILIDTPEGKYGDYMVKQQVTKEEREARIEMPILGNGKIIGGSKPEAKQRPPQPRKESINADGMPDGPDAEGF